MASFEEIIRHMHQLETPDRERDNPHRAEPENMSNLCGNLVELRWLWVEVPPGSRPYGPEAGLDIPQS